MAEESPEEALAEMKEVIEEESHTPVGEESTKPQDEESVAPTEGAAQGEIPAPEGEIPAPEGEIPAPEGEIPPPEGEIPAPEGEKLVHEGEKRAPEAEKPVAQGEQPAPVEVESDLEEDTEEELDEETREITAEEHEENIVVMGDVLQTVLDLAAEGKLPTKEEKEEFKMKATEDSSEELLTPQMEMIEEVTLEDELVSPEGSLEEKLAEEEEEESASIQEAWARRQQLLAEFDAAHDEAQRLRILHMLLQGRVLRCMQRRPKAKGAHGSTASAASNSSTSSRTSPPVETDTVGIAESLERELLEAGEVRRQLDAELHPGGEQEALRQQLCSARSQVSERAAQLQQLQEKALARLRAPPAKRQEAERMLRRVWPQLLRLRRERLRHTRAANELECARQQVGELEAFGPQRTVAAYEQLEADGVKLAERAQERAEQLAALRGAAERDLQQAAHLREALQGARLSAVESRRSDVKASVYLQRARKEVLKTKKQRDDLYKENAKLTRQMELLAYPELLRNHEEVRRRLRVAQADLEKLRAAYINQERRIALARKLLQQREQSLSEGGPALSPHQSFLKLYMDTKCGPSQLELP